MEISFSKVHSFFDSPAVVASVANNQRLALSKAGAFVRTRARSSIRRRKRSSKPGEPPSAHSKSSLSLKTIIFAYDAQSESVIVGPVKLNQRETSIYGSTTVPRRLERGGIAKIREERFRATATQPAGRWWRRNMRRSTDPRKEYRVRTAEYEARPFMRPALEKEAPNFPDLFRNAIRK